MAVVIRQLRRSVAAFVDDFGVCLSLKQQVDHRFAAVERSPVEGGLPVVAQGIGLCIGLKQLGDNAFVALVGGIV